MDVVEDLGLTRSWDKFTIDFTHCHELLGTSYVATLDHFFWSEGLEDNVTDAGVLHLPDNQSDHSPIFCVLEYQDAQHQVHKQAQQNSDLIDREPARNRKLATRTLWRTEFASLLYPHQ